MAYLNYLFLKTCKLLMILYYLNQSLGEYCLVRKILKEYRFLCFYFLYLQYVLIYILILFMYFGISGIYYENIVISEGINITTVVKRFFTNLSSITINQLFLSVQSTTKEILFLLFCIKVRYLLLLFI